MQGKQSAIKDRGPSRASSKILLLCALMLPAYIFCLLWPQQYLTTWVMNASAVVQAKIRLWNTIGIVIFTFLGLLSLAPRQFKLPIINKNYLFLLIIFATWLLCTAFWSIDHTSTIVYALILAPLVAACSLYWCLPKRYLDISIASSLVVGGVLMLYLFSTLSLVGRNLGGIHPNAMGHIGLAFLVLGYVAGGRVQVLGLVLGMWLIFTGQARTVFLGALVFLLLYHVAMPYIRDPKSLVRMAVCAVFGLLIVSLTFGPIVEGVSAAATELLGVTDAARTGEGFTGRDQLWQNGFDTIRGHELTGYGFRTRGSKELSLAGLAVNAHSGWINAALDIGLIGLTLYMAIIASAAFMMARNWGEFRSSADRTGAAFLVAMVPILAVEPNYLNLGSGSHFIMLLFLARPLISTPRHRAGRTVPHSVMRASIGRGPL